MKKLIFLLGMMLLLVGCGGKENDIPQAEVVLEEEVEVKEPQIVYQLKFKEDIFADVCVLSDTLYAYKIEEDSNWIVAKLEDDTVLDISTGEELLPYLQDDAFAFNAFATPNNYLYDAEGNLLWEAEGKVSSGNGPDIQYTDFLIMGYADNVLSFEQRKGFVTAYLDQLTDFDLVNYLQVIDFGRVVGMPFANGYLTSDINYKTPFGIFNLISREQERITIEYEDYYMSIYDSSVSTDGWVYVNFVPKALFGKDDSQTVTGFYNVETGEARIMENFFAVEIKHFSENGNVRSSVKNGVAVMYGEPQAWYGKASEYIQDPPHYRVYDVENGVVLKEDVRDVKMAEDTYVLVQGQDEKWQYADVTTFTEMSEKYDSAALFQDDMGIVLRAGHPAVIDRDFQELFVDEQIMAEDVMSMGHGYYQLKVADGYQLFTVSVEIIE